MDEAMPRKKFERRGSKIVEWTWDPLRAVYISLRIFIPYKSGDWAQVCKKLRLPDVSRLSGEYPVFDTESDAMDDLHSHMQRHAKGAFKQMNNGKKKLTQHLSVVEHVRRRICNYREPLEKQFVFDEEQ